MRQEAENRLANLNDQKANLAYEMEKLQSDSGIEEKIRTKFNFVKPGERVVVIVAPAPTTTAATSTGFFSNLWQKIWD